MYEKTDVGHYCILQYGLILISARINDYIYHKVWDKNIYPFPKFNAATV